MQKNKNVLELLRIVLVGDLLPNSTPHPQAIMKDVPPTIFLKIFTARES